MSRPLYETEQDRKKERALIERVVPDRFSIRKLPIKLRADFGLFSWDTGNLAWYAEVRCRNNPKHQYSTFFTSLDKMLSVAELVNSTGKPLTFIVGWTDEIGRFDFKKGDSLDDFDIKWGGRGQLRDAQDEEPMMHIPIDKFKVVNLNQ